MTSLLPRVAVGSGILLLALGCSSNNNDDADTSTTDTNPNSEDTAPDTAEQTEEVEPFTLSPGVNALTWDEELSIGTTTRQLIIQTPQSYPNHDPLPVVFAFHGNAAGAPEGVEPEKAWIDALGPMVDQERFIGIYLRGIEGGWQLGPELGDITTDEVIATLEYLKSRIAISPGVDAETTYCFGTSNGAALCQYAAANVGMFSGVGAEVSTLDEGGEPNPELPKVSVVQMMNLKDRTIPYEGGPSSVGHTYMPAEEGAAAWAAHNGCDPNPSEEVVADPYKKTLMFSNCEENTVVVHVGALPIPWDDSCESGEPPDEDLCGNDHSVADEHFALPGGPWRYAYDLLSGQP